MKTKLKQGVVMSYVDIEFIDGVISLLTNTGSGHINKPYHYATKQYEKPRDKEGRLKQRKQLKTGLLREIRREKKTGENMANKKSMERKTVSYRILFSWRGKISDSKYFYIDQIEQFVKRFNPKEIRRVDFGKQDIRGAESITLFNHGSCVPEQKFFRTKTEMLEYIAGFNRSDIGLTRYLIE